MKYIEKLNIQTEEVKEVETLEKHNIINNNPFTVDEYIGHTREFLAVEGEYDDGFNQLNETNGLGISCNVSKEVKQAREDVNGVYHEKLKDRIDNIEYGINFVTPEQFGALGDGINDDTIPIQNMLDYANINNKKIVISNNVYIVSSPLVLYSNLIIEGHGKKSIIKAKKEFNNGSDRAIFEIINVNNVTIKDLFIDHNGSVRTSGRESISNIITISNAENITIDNVTFSDCGLNREVVGLGELKCINIIAKDYDGDLSDGVVGSVKNVTIKNCIFELPKTALSSFCIRVKTNWANQRPPEDFINHAEHILIDKCTFNGNWEWNVIEFAGGGTRHNTVSNSLFEGQTVTSIDFDKGSNNNIAINNIIRNGGFPDYIRLNVSEAGKLACINVHGAGIGNDISKNYSSDNNKILYNRIYNINNNTDTQNFSCLIGIGYAENTIIQGNIIGDLNNSSYGRGIMIDHQVKNLTIRDNILYSCKMGIVTNSNATNTIDNITIDNNVINTETSPITLTQGSAVGNGYCKITNNVVTSKDTTTNKGITVTVGFYKANVENNYVDGGVDNYHLFVEELIAIGNKGINSKTYGMRLNTSTTSKSCLIGNQLSKTYSKGNGTVTGIGNSFDIV